MFYSFILFDNFYKITIRFLFVISLFYSIELSGVERTSIGIFTSKIQGVGYWDPDSICKGIAGSEEAVIYISKQLAIQGYQVTVYGNPPENSRYSDRDSNPRFVDVDTIEHTALDIAISWRMPFMGDILRKKAKTVYLWPHDTIHYKLSDEQINSFDDVLWLSDWQRKQWISVNPEFAQYIHVFGNGISQDQLYPITERVNPYSCIYGSNYARGLEILLDLWPEIKRNFPKATLDIYYGWQHWGLMTSEQEVKMRRQIKEYACLAVTDHEKVGHQELNKAYAEASIWAYPCICPETFCITALRAQASGAIPVIIQGSALEETVQEGFRCSDRNGYFLTLLQAMNYAEKISLEERKKIKENILGKYTWRKIAEKWNEIFQRDLEKLKTQSRKQQEKSLIEPI